MQAFHIQVARRHRLFDRLFGVPRLDRKAEFGIENPCSREQVGVRVHARRHAQHYRLNHAALTSHLVKQPDLVEGVDCDMPNTVVEGLFQLRPGLVVTVKVQPFGRKPRCPRHGQLSTGHHVHTESLGLKQPCQNRRRKGLGGVEDRRAGHLPPERTNELAAHVPYRRFVVYVQRRAELLSEFGQAAPADRNFTVCIQGGRDRK